MVQVNLKRKYENNSCTHGILTIPAYNFKCLTLELCDGDNKVYKQDCRISEGMYPLVQGYAQGWPMFPILKKKPKGFARKPGFNLSADCYMELPTGDIALGTEKLDNFSIRQSDGLATAFKDIFQDVFFRKEIAMLCVYKSNNYVTEDVGFFQTLEKMYDFINDDDFDEDELEDDRLDG